MISAVSTSQKDEKMHFTHMTESWLEFALFNAMIVVFLLIDLGLFHKKSHIIKMKEALIMSAVWISAALLFNVYVLFAHGSSKALEFLTGYVIEKSLSVDNLFVFLSIFGFFAVPREYQQKVLFWGIVVAMILRGIFIFAGISLIERFHFLIYLFGAFLIYTGIKIFATRNAEKNPGKSWFVKLVHRALPFSEGFDADRFTTREKGKPVFTRLFLVFIVINIVDVIFAFDSIPAIFAITLDPFIVYTSNIFAILGLRALYFVLAGAAASFYYINHALSVILCYVGLKMIVSGFYKIDALVSLAFIAGVLASAIAASVVRNRKKNC
ncbi:MAG TPA: TerC family protein [Candidatus Goldiibacteriota bacterium]|nr:TerC family protein [Candidatus Goldiibacteriota bacterium]